MRASVCQRRWFLSAALLFGAGCVLAGSSGCQHDESADMTMPSDKLKAITAADAVISTGDREIENGKKLHGTDPDQAANLIKQGEADKSRGEEMKSQAVMMK